MVEGFVQISIQLFLVSIKIEVLKRRGRDFTFLLKLIVSFLHLNTKL